MVLFGLYAHPLPSLECNSVRSNYGTSTYSEDSWNPTAKIVIHCSTPNGLWQAVLQKPQYWLLIRLNGTIRIPCGTACCHPRERWHHNPSESLQTVFSLFPLEPCLAMYLSGSNRQHSVLGHFSPAPEALQHEYSTFILYKNLFEVSLIFQYQPCTTCHSNS